MRLKEFGGVGSISGRVRGGSRGKNDPNTLQEILKLKNSWE